MFRYHSCRCLLGNYLVVFCHDYRHFNINKITQKYIWLSSKLFFSLNVHYSSDFPRKADIVLSITEELNCETQLSVDLYSFEDSPNFQFDKFSLGEADSNV